jgi:hypothetical protein
MTKSAKPGFGAAAGDKMVTRAESGRIWSR